jgi:hypothetical protein
VELKEEKQVCASCAFKRSMLPKDYDHRQVEWIIAGPALHEYAISEWAKHDLLNRLESAMADMDFNSLAPV